MKKSKKLIEIENETITLFRCKYGEYRESLGFWKGLSLGLTLWIISNIVIN